MTRRITSRATAQFSICLTMSKGVAQSILTVKLVSGPEVVGVAPGDEVLAVVRGHGQLEGELLQQRVRVQPQDPLRALAARLAQQLAQQPDLRVPACIRAWALTRAARGPQCCSVLITT